MKGIFAAGIILFISFIFGQIIDQSIDNTIKISSGLVIPVLYALKILLGLPTDILEFVAKLILVVLVVIGGESV